MRYNGGRRVLTALIGVFAVVGGPLPGSALAANGGSAQKTEFIEGREVAANEALVKFRDLATPESIAHAEQDEDVDADAEIGGTGVRLFHSRSKNAATLVHNLSARADVLYAEPNFIVRAVAVPNDPRFPELWGLQNTGQPILGVAGTPGADISAVSAWDISTGSRATVVAVVDTGIDYTHPDLAANIWSAPAPFTVTIGGLTITCIAGTHGFNVITNTCDPMDDNNHGTHVSGTIGAVGNNGLGVVGVNWTVDLMGAKFLNKKGSGTLAGAINAIEFTIQAKAAFSATAGANVRVLSNSWGCTCFSQALLDEITRANTNNMLFVAAAGNSSSDNNLTPFYPASYTAPNVVAVAATDNTDALAWFSNYGSTSVHLGAPGVSVLSTIIGGLYDYFSGTSMATPHVSGAAALVLSSCPLDTASLKSNLLTNVDLIPSLSGLTITNGRLNVNKAIRACSAPATPAFSISATPPSQTVAPGTSATYTVTVSPSGGFTGLVSLSVTGLPGGASASFNPPSVPASGSSTMTVSTPATTTPGTYPLTITGTSGSLQQTTSASLVVALPDFSLSISPSSVTVPGAGGTASYTVTINRTGGFSSAVTLSVSGLPSGVTPSFTPNPTTGSSSTLVLTVSSTTAAGSYPFTVTGSGGAPTMTHTATATLVKQNSASPHVRQSVR